MTWSSQPLSNLPGAGSRNERRMDTVKIAWWTYSRTRASVINRVGKGVQCVPYRRLLAAMPPYRFFFHRFLKHKRTSFEMRMVRRAGDRVLPLRSWASLFSVQFSSILSRLFVPARWVKRDVLLYVRIVSIYFTRAGRCEFNSCAYLLTTSCYNFWGIVVSCDRQWIFPL